MPRSRRNQTFHLPREMGGCSKRTRKGEMRREIPATDFGRPEVVKVNCPECITPIVSPGYILPPTLASIEVLNGQIVDFTLRQTEPA